MNNSQPLAVIAGSRTPFAKSFTAMSQITAVDLGTTTIKDLLHQANVKGDAVDEVVMGNVSGPPDA
ncbi:MAG: acetyl-CoA C-acyltransferase, partial [Rubripirellula sp.]